MAHDQVLFLSRSGRAHIIRAHKVPEAARTSKGTAIAQVSLCWFAAHPCTASGCCAGSIVGV